MKGILGIFVLLWLSCLPAAHAQYRKDLFWWGATPEVVQTSLAAQKYWQSASLGDINSTEGKSSIDAFITLDFTTIALFSYYDSVLVKRSWKTNRTTEYARVFDSMIDESRIVSENKWLHLSYGLIITRRLEGDDVYYYTIEPDWEHELANRLPK